MVDRPKASYLDWFKELIANYKLIAMLIVALGGYSGVNLWQDVERYRATPEPVIEKPEQKPDDNHSGFSLIGHSHPPDGHSEAIKALEKALNAQKNTNEYSPLGHTHPEKAFGAFEKALNAHIERDHIPGHAELHQ